ncbi:hypothetical protein BASA50_008930 [Batrachochytrium salamandrivorans]|uniref:Pre-mRNA-splicing factor SYF2 n=1 Tax=Batrachochytrium salamandrivorans TaxID=1357716 RepID=A0ABQ8F2C2_9FUNG|nr:hypothetical protein BASA62_005571 [Batrachochytrium salamandrivorans]KAH6569152.1 hypothetical protein BASA60_008324 [Batrachochytrium salamandrivorans]KAH6590930.1 hypothetical protein BASA50_008930 [Batrachochytrium salamandrivorans]KAH9247715.1 hypothetical protein BASA81_014673 [Batrachochytrium salamandrivorans]KAH9268529.1 hypothetical protein BASA84_000134 [Batrachochytrium salamandrivorans]
MESLRDSVLDPDHHRKEIQLSAASAIDLKAELLSRQEQYDRDKRRLGVDSNVNSIPAVNLTRLKNIPKISKNKGVTARAQKDEAQIADEHPNLEASWVALQRKAKLYDKMIEDPVNEEDEEGLVDFLIKNVSEGDCIRVDKKPDSSSKWVEVTDEFGRTRIVRQSEAESMGIGRFVKASGAEDVAQGHISSSSNMYHEQDSKEWEEATREEAANKHYDTSLERRTMGVGFYNLSQKQDVRQKQLDELKTLRNQTETIRDKSQLMKEKRKSRIEDRRTLLAARALKQQRLETIDKDAYIASPDSVTPVSTSGSAQGNENLHTTNSVVGRKETTHFEATKSDSIHDFLRDIISKGG